MTIRERAGWIGMELLLMAGIGLVLGLLGPFGSYQMPLASRMGWWMASALMGYACVRPLNGLAHLLAQHTSIPLFVAVGMSTAIGAVPLSLLIGFVSAGFRFFDVVTDDQFLALYVQCFAISIGAYMIFALIFPTHGQSAVRDAEQTTALPADGATTPVFASGSGKLAVADNGTLADRLPAGFPEIAALSVEDHYVRVHSGERTEMLLMRLADAIREMDGVDGLQVHRSWWVSRRAVDRIERDGRNVRLLLNGGLVVPVSRPNVARLKESGWTL